LPLSKGFSPKSESAFSTLKFIIAVTKKAIPLSGDGFFIFWKFSIKE